MADDAQFCPACGATFGDAPPAPGAPNPNQQGAYQPPPATAVEYASLQQDADANKVFGILAYIGILVLVTIFAAPKNSKYSRYHANQGLVLCIFGAALGIIVSIIMTIITASMYTSAYSYGYGGIAAGGIAMIIVGIISWLVGILFLIFAIIGIVHAAKGEMKPLPLIGRIKILKVK